MKPMIHFLRRLVLSLLLFSGLVAVLPAAVATEPVEADRIVAVVGDEVITHLELRQRIANVQQQLRKQGIPEPAQNVLERQMLERLIMDRVQLQFARDTGIRVDDSQLDQAMERIAANNRLSLQEFRQALEKDGIPFTKFREDIREEMTLSRLREREVDSKLVISDSEVDNFLETQKATGEGGEYEVAHILLRAPESATPEQLQKLRARAEQALKRARQGDNFAELAAAFSDAPDALQGGALGWRPLNRLPGLYGEALARMAPGEVSDILRSSAGFHIIKLLDKRGSIVLPPVRQTHARHILLRINEVVSETEARRKMENLRERLIHGAADFAELARLYSQDASAAKGGDLGWLNPGDTVPEFERAMDALKDKEISPVVQSPFGMHLIQVLERRQRDISEERQRFNARQALRERKREDAYQDWLRQLRDRSYVENRLEEK